MSKSTRTRHQEVSKVSKVSEGKVAEVLMIHKSAHSTISKEMRTSVMKVTPEIAQAWLGTRGKQRSINRHTVDSFARDMKQGAWETTHQGIAFNLMGQLIDGQHRLMAVVQSETPVMMVVTLGCPAEYDSPIDRGRARSIGDIINKSGTLVAICNALIIIENGTQGRTTPSEVLEMYNKHLPGVTFALGERGRAIKPRITAAIFAAFAYAFPTSPEKASQFAHKFHTGEGLARGDGALALRGWFEREMNRGCTVPQVANAVFGAMRGHWKNISHSSINAQATMGKLYFDAQRRLHRLPAPPAPKTGTSDDLDSK